MRHVNTEKADLDHASALARRSAEGASRALAWAAAHPRLPELTRSDSAWLYAGHKGLATLATGAQYLQGAELATWLVRNRLRADGDIGELANREGPARAVWLYFNSWISWGAHRMFRYDLSVPATRFIASCQSGDGSFPSNPHGPEQVVDLFVTSASGLALADTGHLEEAARAAAFVARELDDQPRDDGLTIAWGRDEEGRRAVQASPDRTFIRYHDEGKQHYFSPGMALVFLSRMWLATGDGAILAAAERCRDACRRMLPGAARWGQGGKVGWGAALLWQITGNPTDLDLAARVLGYVLETQAEDGRWPRDEAVNELDTAFEFGFILAESARALAAPLGPT
jgi:hypothetical protein